MFDALDEGDCISECVLSTKEHEPDNDIVSNLEQAMDELY